MTSERWLPVVGYEGIYEVSDAGRVRRVLQTRATRGGVLRPAVRDGYSKVSLYRDGKGTQATIHRLVALAFIGPQPSPQHLVRHLDDVPSNNVPANLAWGTAKENSRDAVRNGHNPLARRDRCSHGHPFDEKNTRWVGTRRNCRTCERVYAKRTKQRAKEKAG